MPEPTKKYTGQELCSMREQLVNNQNVFVALWESLRFFYKPQDRTDYTFNNNVGGKRVPQTTKGMRARSILASGLYSNTINLSDDFFSFSLSDKDLAESDEVKDYFAKCTEITVSKLAASNYALSTFETIDRDWETKTKEVIR